MIDFWYNGTRNARTETDPMYIITGATGHIGNTLARLFSDRKIPFKILARQSGPALESLQCPMVFGDIFDPDFLSREVEPGDVFFHLAGMIDLTNKHRQELFAVNDLGTRRIADFCLKNRVRLVYTSSTDAIYKPDPHAVITEPTTLYPERFSSDYAASKAAGTLYVHRLMNESGLDAVILYPSAVIGVNDYKPSAAGKEIQNCSSRRLFFYIKGGYNFIDVRDAAEAILQAGLKPVRGSYLVTGYPMTIRDLYQSIAQLLNKKVFLVRVPVWLARLGAMFLHDVSPTMVEALLDNSRFDNSKMRRDLLPQLRPFSETLRDTIEWFRDHPSDESRAGKKGRSK